MFVKNSNVLGSVTVFVVFQYLRNVYATFQKYLAKPTFKNKKALLSERKRHTARRVASTGGTYLGVPTLDWGRDTYLGVPPQS